MAFSPASTIRLCRVPFDNDYKHVRWFSSFAEQKAYFESTAVSPISLTSGYTFIRKNKTVKVPMYIDDIMKYNYLIYVNNETSTDPNTEFPTFSQKMFFNFITSYEYVNDHTTLIHYECDVMQTWMFDIQINASYVVREHTNNDTRFANKVPEDFKITDYILVTQGDLSWSRQNTATLIYALFALDSINVRNADGTQIRFARPFIQTIADRAHSTIDRMLASGWIEAAPGDEYVFTTVSNTFYFPDFSTSSTVVNRLNVPYYISVIYSTNAADAKLLLASFINMSGEWGITDSIVKVVSVPYEIYSNLTLDTSNYVVPIVTGISGDIDEITVNTSLIGGTYDPVNEKLFNYPFCYWELTSPDGTQVYNPEFFSNGVKFKGKFSLIGTNIEEWLPVGYGIESPDALLTTDSGSGVPYNYAIDIPISKDNAAISLALNAVSNKTSLDNISTLQRWNTIRGGIELGLNAITAVPRASFAAATGGASLMAQGAKGLSSLTQSGTSASGTILNTIENNIQLENQRASIEAKIADTSSKPITMVNTVSPNSFYTETGLPAVRLNYYTITKDQAMRIDRYMSVYGYKTSQFKIPNITGRSRWNYVETENANIEAGLQASIPPDDDIRLIKRIFNNGVTFWHDNDVGNYGTFINSII